MIKAVIFDFDGTLVDNMKFHYDSFVRALEGKIKVEKERLYMMEGGHVFPIVSELVSDLNLNDHEIENLIEKKKKIYSEMTKNLKMRPEAIELIEKLRKLNYRIGLATGSHKHVVDVHVSQEEYGLFDYVLTLEQTKKPKPDPEPYMKCAKGLDVKPEEVVVIENAPLGVESAKSAGMICIALTSTVSKEDLERADFVVESLNDVEDIIKSL